MDKSIDLDFDENLPKSLSSASSSTLATNDTSLSKEDERTLDDSGSSSGGDGAVTATTDVAKTYNDDADDGGNNVRSNDDDDDDVDTGSGSSNGNNNDRNKKRKSRSRSPSPETTTTTAEMSGSVKKKRAAAYVGSSFRDFLGGLSKLSGVGKNVADATSLLKNVKSGVKTFDDVIVKMPISRSKHGVILVGDQVVGAIRQMSRAGDLEALVKVAKQPISVSGAEKNAFRSLVGNTPERSVKDLGDLVVKNKQLHPTLDSTVENVGKLSATSKRDLKQIESNLTKRFKQGAAIALTIGTVYVGVDWITKATEARKGCFMLTTINNKTTSCKIAAYSCIGGSDDGANKCSSVPNLYNITLLLMTIAELDNTDKRKIDVANAADVVAADLKSQLSKVIDSKYEAVSKVITDMPNKPVVNVCGIVSPQVENGKIPPCRMCSPSDNPISTTFIDPSQYAENITFQCVVNPSILDTITDAVSSTGVNLWEGVSKSLLGPLKRFGIIGAILVALLLIVWLVVKLFAKK